MECLRLVDKMGITIDGKEISTFPVEVQGKNGNGIIHFWKICDYDSFVGSLNIAIETQGRLSKKIELPLNVSNSKLVNVLGEFYIELEMKKILNIAKTVSISTVPMSYSYRNPGFTDDFDSFKGSHIINSDGKKFDICSSQSHLKSEGMYSNWLRMVQEKIVGREVAEIILAASFAAPIVDLLDRENVVINIAGKTSIGKTTIGKLVLSVWTDVEDKNFRATWDATEIGLTDFVMGQRGIPLIIEDASLMDESIERKIRGIIYRLKEGSERRRSLYGKKVKDSTQKAKTVILMNSEESIIQKILEDGKTHKGVFGRLIEIPVSKGDLTMDGSEASAIDKVVKSNYGIAGVKFIEFLFKNEILQYKLKEMYATEVEKIKKYINQTNELMNRLAQEIAVITMTAELVKNGLNIPLNVDLIRRTLIEICKKNLEEYIAQPQNVKELTNEELYMKLYKEFDNDDYIREVEHNGVRKYCICVEPEVFEDHYKKYSSNSFRAFTRYLLNNSLIFAEGGKENRKTLHIDKIRYLCLNINDEGAEA